MTTVRLPDDLVAAMTKLTARDGIPASEQIRRALREWLASKRVYQTKRDTARKERKTS